VTDENKQMIVEAGALPLYVKLLRPQHGECVQREAAKGLWSMAFKCRQRILDEQGCLAGRHFNIIRPIINPLKRSDIRWLHLEVFSAIQV